MIRLRAIWYILRGWSVAYRLDFAGSITVAPGGRLAIADCDVQLEDV